MAMQKGLKQFTGSTGTVTSVVVMNVDLLRCFGD